MRDGVIGMDVLKTVSGLELLQGMIAGKYPSPPIAELLDMRLTHAENGRAVFEANPGIKHYNPLGSVHGGFAATILDSCMACAVQTMLDAQGKILAHATTSCMIFPV